MAKNDGKVMPADRSLALERISFECMDKAKTLDARLRGHDGQEVIPAKTGIQEPYIQLQAILKEPWPHRGRNAGYPPLLPLDIL